jgi:hypothetical protein
MRYKISILLIVTCSLSISCDPKKTNLIGTYVANNNSNSIDSLYLFEDGHYKHCIYQKKSDVVLLLQEGFWEYKKGFIELSDFYFNDNRLYKENLNYNFIENSSTAIISVKSEQDLILIEINELTGNYYQKIIRP